MGKNNWSVYGWKRGTSFITQKGGRRCLNISKFVALVAFMRRPESLVS